jgi:general secretion pathway protein C
MCYADMAGEPGNFKNRLSELARNFSTRLQSLTKRDANAAPVSGGPSFFQRFAESLKHFEPAAAAEWATNAFQRQNAAFFGKIATILLCSYFVGDLSAILMSKFLPEAPQSHPRASFGMRHAHNLDDFNVVFARNLFNSNGIIPGEEIGNPEVQDNGGVPVRTTLPLNLIGTLILRDELRSIATIEDKTASQVYPVRELDEIPSKAKILKIEPRKVIFLNTSNHRREFVDLPEAADTGAPRITLGTKTAGGTGIEQVAAGQFTVARAEVDRALSDLNNILTQARAVPNFENGQPNGYKLFQIVPGSIYQKLGIQEGDVICGFDGQPANDPAAAFEKLSNLKNTSHLDLCIKRSGKQSTYSYDFK